MNKKKSIFIFGFVVQCCRLMWCKIHEVACDPQIVDDAFVVSHLIWIYRIRSAYPFIQCAKLPNSNYYYRHYRTQRVRGRCTHETDFIIIFMHDVRIVNFVFNKNVNYAQESLVLTVNTRQCIWRFRINSFNAYRRNRCRSKTTSKRIPMQCTEL